MFACPTSALIFLLGVGNAGFLHVSPATEPSSGFGRKLIRFANLCKAPGLDVPTPLEATDHAQLSMQGPS